MGLSETLIVNKIMPFPTTTYAKKKTFYQNFAFGKIYHRVTGLPQVLWKTPECIPSLVTQQYLCRCIVTLCENK